MSIDPKKELKEASECVKVVVRCRPLNKNEIAVGAQEIVKMDTKKGQVWLKDPDGDKSEEPKMFTFDHVYPPGTPQKLLFEETARPIVDSVIEGYNGTIFCYGQTGTGKTFSMEGVPEDENLRGIMPNAFYHVFNSVDNMGSDNKFMVRCTFIEIYMEQVYDLLSTVGRVKLDLKEHPEKGVFVAGLTEHKTTSVRETLNVLAEGQKLRKVGATAMNEGSSRSHSIFTVIVETQTQRDDGSDAFKMGKLNMVDLAGSERQKKTKAEGDRLEEAKSINLSLSSLGNVIKALVSAKKCHVPFRDSKLTRLLQDSLGGNTKTVMVANCGPADSNYEETMSTLRYADRAKQIKNKPKINEDPKDALLRQYSDEIAALRKTLLARKEGLGSLAPAPGGVIKRADGTEFKVSESGQIIQEVIEETEQIVYQDTGLTEEEYERVRKEKEEEIKALEAAGETELAAEKAKQAAAEAEKQRLVAEAQKRRAAEEALRAEIEQAEQMLKAKESLVMKGKQTAEYTRSLKENYKKTQAELERKRADEEELQLKIAAAEEAALLINEKYSSQQEELKQTSKKIKLLQQKIQDNQKRLLEITDEFELEKEDLMDTIGEMEKDLKLKALFLDWAVPPAYVEKIKEMAVWDTFNDRWTLPEIELAGNNIERLDDRVDSLQAKVMQVQNSKSRGNSFNPMAAGSDDSRTQMIMAAIREPLPRRPPPDPYFSYRSYVREELMQPGGDKGPITRSGGRIKQKIPVTGPPKRF